LGVSHKKAATPRKNPFLDAGAERPMSRDLLRNISYLFETR
jgi:hypothetical protein